MTTLILRMKKLGSGSVRRLPKVMTLLNSREQRSWDLHPRLSSVTSFPKCGKHTSVGHKVSFAGK